MENARVNIILLLNVKIQIKTLDLITILQENIQFIKKFIKNIKFLNILSQN